jgi:FkbM family methyltransferase
MLIDFEYLGIDVSKVSGAIHIGAHWGEERYGYAEHNLDVLWFEPNPEVFKKLQENIAEFPKQKAYQLLVINEDDKEYTFHIAKNGDAGASASSSLLKDSGLTSAYPSVTYVKDILITGLTLDTFFKRHTIDKSRYQFLSIDTEGSELLVLEGMVEILPYIQFAEIEVVTGMNCWYNGSTVEEIDAFMISCGFKKKGMCFQCGSEIGNGKVYNALYQR